MDVEMLERVLALPKPWTVTSAELDERNLTVDVRVCYAASVGPCPKCGEPSKGVGA